ncbi:MAG: DNA translocase FtsK, partial [Pseudomonadota bacterium]
AFSLKALSLALGIATLVIGLFVFGATREDVSRTIKFGLIALIMTYAALRSALSRSAKGAALASAGLTAGVQNQIKKRAERREAHKNAYEEEYSPHSILEEPPLKRRVARVILDEDAEDMPQMAAPKPFFKEKTGLLARMPSLIRRPDPDPELLTAEYEGEVPDAPEPDRIRAKIANAIKSRRPQSEPALAPTPLDKPLTKGRGRGPDPDPELLTAEYEGEVPDAPEPDRIRA